MKRDTIKTKVIFRTFKKEGDCIALFPEIPANYSPHRDCESYQSIGGHGAANVNLTRETRPATAKEIAPLARTLRRIGYRLETRKRFTRSMHAQRLANFER